MQSDDSPLNLIHEFLVQQIEFMQEFRNKLMKEYPGLLEDKEWLFKKPPSALVDVPSITTNNTGKNEAVKSLIGKYKGKFSPSDVVIAEEKDD